MNWPLTQAEKKAVEAQTLPSFPINIDEIRRTISTLLSEFGRYGFFDEYTVHNFDHVYEMLKCLDWLIPADTHPLLSKGDWLFLTLACYFHDLGLLVTRDEFESRHTSGFDEFCERVLFSGPDGADYRAKVFELNEDKRERLLYQEFVRYNHAARVRGWIVGRPVTALGKAQAAATEVNRLLSPLDDRIRVDLANVCESHNLNDIDNELKYPLFQPYGGGEDETVNLQYAAVLLRTTDLIQITRQRAPTVLFRTVSPTDPISQVEWLKQNAVRHIRPKPKEDRAGTVSKETQSDTIEVYADFQQAEGFFGLTAYLKYAERELQQSFGVIEKAKRKVVKKLLSLAIY
jgi:molecular chaperone HtpG